MARDFKERGRQPKKVNDRLSPRRAGQLAAEEAEVEMLTAIAEIDAELAHLDDEIRHFDNYTEVRGGR